MQCLWGYVCLEAKLKPTDEFLRHKLRLYELKQCLNCAAESGQAETTQGRIALRLWAWQRGRHHDNISSSADALVGIKTWLVFPMCCYGKRVYCILCLRAADYILLLALFIISNMPIWNCIPGYTILSPLVNPNRQVVLLRDGVFGR